MDIFMEKIVAKRKKPIDTLITLGLIIGGIALIMVVANLPIPGKESFEIFIFAAIAYGVFYLSKSRNIEFEYAVTNGDLDIDKIISQRKRKRIFSANCKDFEIVAKYNNEKFNGDYKNIKKTLEAVSSMDATDIYFVVLNYKGERMVVFFQPAEKMLSSFKMFIPRKVFI